MKAKDARALKMGERVTITSGEIAGERGRVFSVTQKGKVTVSLDDGRLAMGVPCIAVEREA